MQISKFITGKIYMKLRSQVSIEYVAPAQSCFFQKNRCLKVSRGFITFFKLAPTFEDIVKCSYHSESICWFVTCQELNMGYSYDKL